MKSAAVIKNSNRILSSSDCDWSGIRVGSFIRFGDDTTFYTVLKTNKLTYLKDFEVLNGREIVIRDAAAFLFVNDEVILSYKQYEFDTLFAIPNGGKGYLKGDIVYAQGGVPLIDSESNRYRPTAFRVIEVENGAITQLTVEDAGIYLRAPNPTIEIGGGNGSGACVEGCFKQIDTRGRLERRVEWINPDPITGVVRLDYPVQNGLEKGNLTIDKWEMFLTTPYFGETKSNVSYEIHRDFTPYAKLPLLVRGSRSIDLLHNQALVLIDNELKRLQSEIDLLKSISTRGFS